MDPGALKPHDNGFGFRRTGFEYWVHTYWEKVSERKQSVAWVEEFFKAMDPLSTGAVYVNGLENEGHDRVRAAYGEHYERLTHIKQKYDPGNFFRTNQNIEPFAYG